MQWTDRSLHIKWALHDAFIDALQTESSDGERITGLCRTIVDWKEEVIFSNVFLWCIRVLLRPTRGPAQRGSRRVWLQNNKGKKERGKMVCLWQGSHIKGRKAQFPQLNVPLGGIREGEREREQKKDKRLWTDNTCAGLQIYSNQAARELCHAYFYSQFQQIAAMFQSLTSSCCSSARGQGCGCCIISVSITPG